MCMCYIVWFLYRCYLAHKNYLEVLFLSGFCNFFSFFWCKKVNLLKQGGQEELLAWDCEEQLNCEEQLIVQHFLKNSFTRERPTTEGE